MRRVERIRIDQGTVLFLGGIWDVRATNSRGFGSVSKSHGVDPPVIFILRHVKDSICRFAAPLRHSYLGVPTNPTLGFLSAPIPGQFAISILLECPRQFSSRCFGACAPPNRQTLSHGKRLSHQDPRWSPCCTPHLRDAFPLFAVHRSLTDPSHAAVRGARGPLRHGLRNRL
jgi:hypothetical protein